MQKVRGSNLPSSTGFPDLCSVAKHQTKDPKSLGPVSPLVRVVFVVAEDVVHHGRSPADFGTITCRYPVSLMRVDLWPTVPLISWIGTPLLLMIETAVWRPSGRASDRCHQVRVEAAVRRRWPHHVHGRRAARSRSAAALPVRLRL